MTSAVTSTPRCLAQRTISTLPAVERWHTCRREPTCSASSTSRAMIDSSATAGQPARPSWAETTPSCIWEPSVRRGSWACWAITPSKVLTYSSARRISTGSCTHLPSSLNTRTRAREAAMASSGARDCPPRPTVTAPIGRTSHQPASSPRARTCSTTPAVSATGSVLAIAWTAVKPPSAAARVPVSTVSASSPPGSRRWVWRSTSPGSMMHPSASMTSASSGASRSAPIAAITPSATRTSAASSPYGLAPRMISALMLGSPRRSMPAGGTGRPCGRSRRWRPAR